MNYYYVTVGDNTGDNWSARYLISCRGGQRAACNRAVKMALADYPIYCADDLIILHIVQTVQQ